MRARSVMFAPEVLDLLDGEFDRLLPLIVDEGFPRPYRLPGGDGAVGWYRHQVEAWFANRVIRQLQESTDDVVTQVPDLDPEQHHLSVHTWRARFPGTCARCRGRFEAGTPIGKIDGRYVEWECIEALEQAAFLDTLEDVR